MSNTGKRQKVTKDERKDKILSLLDKSKSADINELWTEDIAARLHLKSSWTSQLLRELATEGKITRVSKFCYRAN